MVPFFKCGEWVHAQMPLGTPFDAECSRVNVSKCQQRISLVAKRSPSSGLVPCGTMADDVRFAGWRWAMAAGDGAGKVTDHPMHVIYHD